MPIELLMMDAFRIADDRNDNSIADDTDSIGSMITETSIG